MRYVKMFPILFTFLLVFSIFIILVEKEPKKNDESSESNNEEKVIQPEQAVEVSQKELMNLGYFTQYWDQDVTSSNSLQNNHQDINQIAIATYHVTANGTIDGFNPQESIDFANKNGLKTYATIQNQFDSDVANKILSDAQLRKTTIDSMLKLVKTNGYTGLNINFENMYANDRENFNQFIKEVVKVLHEHHYPVIVSVPAKTGDFPDWEWSGTFEYKTLGEVADYIQLMSYDQHGTWGEPGSVAGVNWVENVLQYATSKIPSEKILIGLPAYGYDWNLNNSDENKAVSWKEVETLIEKTGAEVQWDSASKSPYFHYTADNGDKHTVWFENEASIKNKTELVHKYKLAGTSMWRMGLEDESFWRTVQEGLDE